MERETKITKSSDGAFNIPDVPIIPFIEGDGIGPDVWRATRKVVDAAVDKTYSGRRRVSWLEAYAGEKGFRQTGEWLPEETLHTIRDHRVAIKGPMTTPVHPRPTVAASRLARTSGRGGVMNPSLPTLGRGSDDRLLTRPYPPPRAADLR